MNDEQSRIPPLYPGYLGVLDRCWRCMEVIPVYIWTPVVWPVETPPDPIPETVQQRGTHGHASPYWVNTCSVCGAPQGGWYLRMEPDGVFFGFPWGFDRYDLLLQDFAFMAPVEVGGLVELALYSIEYQEWVLLPYLASDPSLFALVERINARFEHDA